METIKISEVGLDKLHSEWINSLQAYDEHLRGIDGITRQLQMTIHDLHFQRDLQHLRNELVMQKNVVSELNHEVVEAYNRYLQKEDLKQITLSDLIENNRLRDRIRKTEQSVFMLKYQVSKLLSIAS